MTTSPLRALAWRSCTGAGFGPISFGGPFGLAD